MAPRLKVFVTSDGLTDFVVATTSKAKALAAWGSHQDLFKTGLARESDDAALIAEASAQPDKVLRRPAGTRGELAALKRARPARKAGPAKAALKKVSDLEARLARLEAQQAAAREALAQRQQELERERAELDLKQADERARLKQQLSAARQALGS